MCLALFSYSNSVCGLMINEHIHMFRTKLNRKRLSFQVYFYHILLLIQTKHIAFICSSPWYYLKTK